MINLTWLSSLKKAVTVKPVHNGHWWFVQHVQFCYRSEQCKLTYFYFELSKKSVDFINSINTSQNENVINITDKVNKWWQFAWIQNTTFSYYVGLCYYNPCVLGTVRRQPCGPWSVSTWCSTLTRLWLITPGETDASCPQPLPLSATPLSSSLWVPCNVPNNTFLLCYFLVGLINDEDTFISPQD